MLKVIRKRASWKKVLITFILSQILMMFMVFFTFPAITHGGSGLTPFDMTGVSGYDDNYAETFIQNLTHNGRMIFLFLQEPLDVVYPFLYAISFVMALCLLCKDDSRWPLLGFIPMVFDYLENLFVIIMLSKNPIPSFLPSIASIMSRVKATTTILCFVLLAVLAVKRLVLNPPHARQNLGKHLSDKE